MTDQANRELPERVRKVVEESFAPFGLREDILRQLQEMRDDGWGDLLIGEALEGMVSAAARHSKRGEGTLADCIRRAVTERRLRNHLDGLRERVTNSEEAAQWGPEPGEDWLIGDE